MLRFKSNPTTRAVWLALPPIQLFLAILMLGFFAFTDARHDIAGLHPVALAFLALAVCYTLGGAYRIYQAYFSGSIQALRRRKKRVFASKHDKAPSFWPSVLSTLLVEQVPNIACVANARTLALIRFRAPTRYIKRRDVARIDFETCVLHLKDGTRVDVNCPGSSYHRFESAFFSPLYTLCYGEPGNLVRRPPRASGATDA